MSLFDLGWQGALAVGFALFALVCLGVVVLSHWIAGEPLLGKPDPRCVVKNFREPYV